MIDWRFDRVHVSAVAVGALERTGRSREEEGEDADTVEIRCHRNRRL